MLEPLYLPDDFFAFIMLKFFYVDGCRGSRSLETEEKKEILYFSELNKTPSVQFVV